METKHEMHWGILGPGTVESTRRVRTLGLAASTRQFNELAVPGLGGVWFGRQLYLATLGVLVAERAQAAGSHVSRIAVANAVEALGCWLALDHGKRADARIRGSTKLKTTTPDELSFAKVSRPTFYVTQPMRMSTVTALPALGLVETSGSRFNSFRCTPNGLKLVEAVGGEYRPHRCDLVEYLVRWVRGKDSGMATGALREALSPVEPMREDARLFLKEVLRQGAPDRPIAERLRRAEALAWVQTRRRGAAPIAWDGRPAHLGERHWEDLRAGAGFFGARDAALTVLDRLEAHMGTAGQRFSLSGAIPATLESALSGLRDASGAFLALEHENAEANEFCRETRSGPDIEVLRRLVERDGRVLRLIGHDVCAGPAFHGAGAGPQMPAPEQETVPSTTELTWPEGISHRVPNLWSLSLDIEGSLDAWLRPRTEESQIA